MKEMKVKLPFFRQTKTENSSPIDFLKITAKGNFSGKRKTTLNIKCKNEHRVAESGDYGDNIKVDCTKQ